MPLLDRDDCVLVVVDSQPGFLAREAEPAVERMAWLVAIAARLDIPIVVTEEDPKANGETDPRIVEVLPATARIFAKSTFGLADSPEILDAVRSAERHTVVLVGCETDVCVAQSAIGLQTAGFASVVIEDAAFSPDPMHERGLIRLASEGVARNHAKGVTYEWLRTVSSARSILHDPTLPSPPFQL